MKKLTARQRIERSVQKAKAILDEDIVGLILRERNLLKRRVRRLAMIRLCNREEDVGYRYAIKYILKIWEE